MSGARILWVEDDKHIRWLVEEYLRREGMEVLAVADGFSALDAIARAPQTKEPIDLVLMDVNMPVMGGVETMQRMRGASYLGPIVALTAYSESQGGAGWSTAGWDAVATKPINPKLLLPMIQAILRERRGRETETTSGT
jgi:two-component system phosphate regulon response regulator PhoB